MLCYRSQWRMRKGLSSVTSDKLVFCSDYPQLLVPPAAVLMLDALVQTDHMLHRHPEWHISKIACLAAGFQSMSCPFLYPFPFHPSPCEMLLIMAGNWNPWCRCGHTASVQTVLDQWKALFRTLPNIVCQRFGGFLSRNGTFCRALYLEAMGN